MNRQKLRKTIIFISFLLFPLTLYYFSPYLIIQGAAEGVVSGSFIVFTAMFIGSLIFGRLFCGWICPAGGLQEACTLISDKKAKGGKLNLIKYFVWIPWILSIALSALHAGGFKKLDFFYETFYGISVSRPEAYIIYYIVVFLIFMLFILGGKRSFCHYLCWMSPFMIIGKNVSKLLRIPSLNLKSEKEKCIGCGQCSKKCPMSLDVKKMVQEKGIEDNECILCGECIEACPKKVITYTFKHKSAAKSKQQNEKAFTS